MVTSWFLWPWMLVVYRAILTIYSTVVFWGGFIDVAIHTPDQAGAYWYYFTNLSYLGLNIYLVLVTIATAAHARTGWLPSQGLHVPVHLLYATVLVSHVVTPVTFYALLFSPDEGFARPMLAWGNYSKHGGDLALTLMEVLVNRRVMYWSDLPITLITAIVYMCWMFLVHAFAHIWPYPFLGWEKGGGVAKWYIIMMAMFIVAFAIMWTLHWGKNWLLGRFRRASSGKSKWLRDPEKVEGWGSMSHGRAGDALSNWK
ncbi:hypothetical protein BJ684DRAFT_12662 [Piptocephalis cylindrospora]|uniref:FAR-17a/AIG1-like protein n=1 Tax=Piptocephalis cylindrospora TaxID=1907219 RepID=A0A4V1IXN0_9FUNG|nr:hypothetical protein BJ684DRAFT_12662 [Piptocephalis cylindrospora]|eukprot:RKP11629.1 hypothetical protein BJ684DRAFT_12662 [Piptocephalis cylindrospora]